MNSLKESILESIRLDELNKVSRSNRDKLKKYLTFGDLDAGDFLTIVYGNKTVDHCEITDVKHNHKEVDMKWDQHGSDNGTFFDDEGIMEYDSKYGDYVLAYLPGKVEFSQYEYIRDNISKEAKHVGYWRTVFEVD